MSLPLEVIVASVIVFLAIAIPYALTILKRGKKGC